MSAPTPITQTLVHWARTPRGSCSRKDSGIDIVRIPPSRPGGATITHLAVAHHPENITCPICRDLERNGWFKQGA